MKDIIKFKKVHPDFQLPKKETLYAAGFDLRYMPEYVSISKDGVWEPATAAPPYSEIKTLLPLGRALFSLGFQVELPPGFEMQLRPRSGWAKKHGITLLNSPGTIDADYRGPVGAILVNLSDEPFDVEIL